MDDTTKGAEYYFKKVQEQIQPQAREASQFNPYGDTGQDQYGQMLMTLMQANPQNQKLQESLAMQYLDYMNPMNQMQLQAAQQEMMNPYGYGGGMGYGNMGMGYGGGAGGGYGGGASMGYGGGMDMGYQGAEFNPYTNEPLPSGLAFDEATGQYYDTQSGWIYDPQTGKYTNPEEIAKEQLASFEVEVPDTGGGPNYGQAAWEVARVPLLNVNPIAPMAMTGLGAYHDIREGRNPMALGSTAAGVAENVLPFGKAVFPAARSLSEKVQDKFSSLF